MKRLLYLATAIITAAIILLFLSGGSTEPSIYEGKIVKKINYYGFKKDSLRELANIIKTREGDPLLISNIAEDRNAARLLGKCKNVDLKYSEYKEGVEITFKCTGFTGNPIPPSKYEGKIIKNINLLGLTLVSKKDILNLMKTKKEKVLRLSELSSDINNIIKIGKFEKVLIRYEEIKDGININIICIEKIFRFLHPEKYEGKIVKEIKVFGLTNLDPVDITDQMKTTVGYPLRASEVRNDIKSVFKEYKLRNIEILIEEYKKGVRLRIFCRESPVIDSIEFKGMDHFQLTDLSDAIPLKETEIFRKDFLERSIQIIKRKYDEDGYFNAVITYKIEKLEEDNAVKIIFLVDEGEEIKVEKISILGVKSVDPEDLIDLMDTKEAGFLEDGFFKKQVYEEDKGKIIAYLKELGYLNAQIVEDSIEYEWENPLLKEKRVIYIIIKINEGLKYYFDKYTVHIESKKGEDTVFKKEDFFEEFSLRKHGEIFNNTKFLKDRQMISFLYASKGYIFSRVVPKRTITEESVTVDGKTVKRKFVKIDFTIKEGKQAYIESIIIKGNKKTKEHVIRREIIIKEGELFDSRKVQISRERIYNLGFFKQVNFDVRPGSTERHMNLIVDVEEQPSGTISLGGGYGTTSGFSIFADLAENNLLGNGQRVGIKFEYGPLRESVTLSFNERWLLGYPIGFNSSLFYNLYRQKDSSIFSNTDETAEHEIKVVGYTVGLSYRFFYYYEVGTRWRHSFKKYDNPSGNSTDEVFLNAALGVQEKRTQSFYLYRNSKDNYMNPTSGSKIGFAVSFTGGNILGGEDHFIRYSPEMNFYYSPFHLPFLKTHPCVIELRGNGTFLGKPIGSSKLNREKPYSENPWLEYEDRLKIGGPETIRGWDYFDNSLPKSWSDVGLHHRILYGIEFRVPIHPQMLWVAFFFDAGSLWTDGFWEKQLTQEKRSVVDEDKEKGLLYDIRDIFSDRVHLMSYFRYSYGFGFRIQIPMMPLRFWFGRKMIYDDGSFKEISNFTFQFAIGDMRF